jgi:hypothetical protein
MATALIGVSLISALDLLGTQTFGSPKVTKNAVNARARAHVCAPCGHSGNQHSEAQFAKFSEALARYCDPRAVSYGTYVA